jgi:heat shock protein HslJ
MSPNLARIAFLAIALAACLPAIGRAEEKIASWLDQPKPASWNTPGAFIPPAPKTQGPIDARCRSQARPAELEEDTRLRDQGWDLVGAYQGGWQMLVILATASYDGMCRPRQYQYFVFVRGIFAGTLSPQPMDSRTDGAAGRVSLRNDGRLTAVYQRYAASDPLCCPSRATSVVFDVANDDPPVVRPMSSATRAHGESTSGTSSAPGLVGTAWQLVRFQGSDDTIVTPGERKYTIELAADGRLTARIDCNRGRGTWKSSGSNQISFGPLALTRAQCPPGSLHDQIVKQWANIRSYVIKDGHLFLALMADGGIFEFEPITMPN